MRLRNPTVLGVVFSGLIGLGLGQALPEPAAFAAPRTGGSITAADAGRQAGPEGGATQSADNAAGSSAGTQAVSLCFKPQPGAARNTVLVIPSGTVLIGRAVPKTSRQSGPMEAVVTTETVTLTDMQPCSGADASTLVSHTRHWEVDPVRPRADVVLRPVGEVSGNGVDTTFDEEPDDFRKAIKSGAVTAQVQGTLKETVALTETQADIPEMPDSASGPDWTRSTGWDQNSLRKTPGNRTE
ncbi:hypothetical protein [Acetobacter orleanensis]|uniref:Uncharacterized protein n=1 Tax=Acetobacter orleanensis TaxID=104099 RepID=A0A4Y3TJI2_9PROT|nr:hypothetical protein [Acetobacter orleanensis]PCD80551.1 hypothetical protein CO710_02035 [Acetobacter orleanensis]GAN68148.1 hypothetical protein Abol_014_199 [Acetobacter orleanensis JCM 7639]GBR26903.1 hypothetical protein AA0473_1276 [Acetobacter orleanensis NRIC 0473]GEB81928.1 hypothetical protein AOR01nite_04050 [Acetobacter orleanensis]